MEGKIRKKLIGAGDYPFAHQIDPLIATCQSRTKLPLLAAQLCPLRALDDPIASNEPVDSNPATDQLQCPSTRAVQFVCFIAATGECPSLFRSGCHRYQALPSDEARVAAPGRHFG